MMSLPLPAILAIGCSTPMPPGDPERPDIVVVSIDTLRADHLGAWGYERDTSPHLDALAASGTRFASAWSPAPWTLPSHATMLSGLHPVHHGGIEGELRLSDDIPWLPEALGGAGYATAGIVTTLFVSDTFGFERGFDHFHDFGIDDEKRNRTANIDVDEVVDHARRWMTQRHGEPVFLFLHLYDVHYEYDPPRPFSKKFDRAPRRSDETYKNYAHYTRKPLDDEQMAHQVAQYDEAIAFVDATLHDLRQAWASAGREALWVVVSDHGEEFGERGSWGHAHTLWPEQLHVPWIVAGPGVASQVVESRVGLEDLAPTLAGLAGVDFPPTDGIDRSPRVRGQPMPDATVAARFAETSRFRTLRYRWHDPPYDLYVDLAARTSALCNLQEDPKCTSDLARDQPQRVADLTSQMWRWLGEPWQLDKAGVLQSSGVFVVDGEVRSKRLPAEAGSSFGLHPADAALTWQDAGGRQTGPWQAVGGERPGDGAPVRYRGQASGTEDAGLTDAQRAALEALGYMQP